MLLPAAVLLLASTPAHAQALRVSSVEFVTGRAGFVDEAWDSFTMAGGAARLQVTPRFALGPEIAYLDGRDGSHGLTITATGTFDLVATRSDRRVVPFVVFGAGLLRQTSVVGRGPGRPGLASYTSSEGTASGGIGVRIRLSPHWVLAPDVRLGYEPETRLSLAVAWRP
ncbi:MAG: outer membrane beta-barrel protein [Vicinamibacterales bacterium]